MNAFTIRTNGLKVTNRYAAIFTQFISYGIDEEYLIEYQLAVKNTRVDRVGEMEEAMMEIIEAEHPDWSINQVYSLIDQLR